MSTRGQSRPEPISWQTSTWSERTERPLTEHREPGTLETDTDTDTEQETEPKETEPEETELEQNKLAELTEELEGLQMAESKGKQTKEQAATTPITETSNPNAWLIGDPGIFSGKRVEFADWWRIMQLHLKFNKVTNPDNKITIIVTTLTSLTQVATKGKDLRARRE
jgi:hypothetical protein